MIENIPLPKLLNDNGAVEKVIHPVSVSINLNIVPLSDATMTLPQGESLPPRSYVQLFTCMGFAGVFRVRSPQDAYGTAYTTAELEHAITEVGDYLVLAEYNEMMAANTAMTTIFSHYRGMKWQLGSVSALGSGQVAVKTNHERVLEAMLGILEQKPDCMMAFDFSTTPWTVNIVAKDTTVTAEGRLARNVNYARVVYDDTELCTRAYYEKLTEGQSTEPSESVWAYVDADTMSTYGLIEKEVKTGSGYTEDEALYIVNEYLRVHKQPRVSVEISAEELSSITGESLDSFAIGKLFRLVLVDYNHLPIEKTITGLSFSNVYETPRAITVMLDQEEDTLINFIHDLDSKGGSGGGGSSGRKQDDELKKFYAEFVNTNKMVGMVVGTFDGEYKVQGGAITLAINEQDESTRILLQADIIDVDGLINALKAKSLEVATIEATAAVSCSTLDVSLNADVGSLSSNAGIRVNGLADLDTMSLGDKSVTWKSKSISTPSYGTRRYFLYAAQSGSTTPTGTTQHYPITSHSEVTIHYLGGAET